jgi:hypothetical protein
MTLFDMNRPSPIERFRRGLLAALYASVVLVLLPLHHGLHGEHDGHGHEGPVVEATCPGDCSEPGHDHEHLQHDAPQCAVCAAALLPASEVATTSTAPDLYASPSGSAAVARFIDAATPARALARAPPASSFA